MFILINLAIKKSKHFKKFNVYLFTTLAAATNLIFLFEFDRQRSLFILYQTCLPQFVVLKYIYVQLKEHKNILLPCDFAECCTCIQSSSIKFNQVQSSSIQIKICFFRMIFLNDVLIFLCVFYFVPQTIVQYINFKIYNHHMTPEIIIDIIIHDYAGDII